MKFEDYILGRDRKFYLICLAGLVLFIVLLGWLVWGSTRWRTQIATSGSYSVQVPMLWHVRTYRGGYRSWPELSLQKDNTFWSNGSFWILQEEKDNAVLEAAVTWGEILIERQNGFDISDVEETTIGDNIPALRRTYKRRYFNQDYYEVYYVVSDDTMYALEFGSKADELEKLNSTFAQIRDSFRFLELRLK